MCTRVCVCADFENVVAVNVFTGSLLLLLQFSGQWPDYQGEQIALDTHIVLSDMAIWKTILLNYWDTPPLFFLLKTSLRSFSFHTQRKSKLKMVYRNAQPVKTSPHLFIFLHEHLEETWLSYFLFAVCHIYTSSYLEIYCFIFLRLTYCNKNNCLGISPHVFHSPSVEIFLS